MNISELLNHIADCPTAFHAVARAEHLLHEAGFRAYSESQAEPIGAGDGYLTRNGSALIAFRIPEQADPSRLSFRITAAHGDSPCLRLKPNAVLNGAYARLNVEPYGGSIHSTWLDTPLGLAGRVSVREEDGVSTRLLYLDRAVAVIPNTAPHLRPMNDGLKLDPKCDLVPVFADGEGDLASLVAGALPDGKAEDILGWDLSLVVPDRGAVFGPKEEFMISPRLDDLECAFGCLDAFLSSPAPENTVTVYALFDNEETGSLSYAGAQGTFLRDTVARILPDEGLRRAALARSFFVSADNAHGLHPNHPELHDTQNVPRLNGGVVIKYNSAQRYMTDSFTASVFAELCREADVPIQYYANRSDQRGGSTLGNLSELQLPVRGVDIGLAQLAMHSARETAGCSDFGYLIRAVRAFYQTPFFVVDGRFFHR